MEYTKLGEIEKALSKIFTKVKISCKPFDYTLKDRVILTNPEKMWDYSASSHNYSDEIELLRRIKEIKPELPAPEYCTNRFINKEAQGYLFGISRSNELFKSFNELSSLIIYKDNLYMNKQLLASILNGLVSGIPIIGIPVDYIGSSSDAIEVFNYTLNNTKLLETLIYVFEIIRKPESLVDILKYLDYKEYDMYKYEDLKNAKYIRDCLDSGTLPELPWINEFPETPFYTGTFLSTEMKSLIKDTSLEKDATITLNKIFVFRFLKYIIELLYLANTMPEDVKDRIYQLMFVGYKPNKLLDLLFESTLTAGTPLDLTDSVKNIIKIHNASDRFEAIKKFINSDEVDKVLSTAPIQVPVIFRYITVMCDEYSNQRIHIETMLRLVEFCRDNKIPIEDLSYREDDEDDYDIDDHEDEDEDEDEESTCKREDDGLHEASMFDKASSGKGVKPKPKSSRSVTHSPSPYDEINKVFSSFKDGIYSYKIKDVYNDSGDSSKEKYEAIAESVNLINKDLIKKIKDIKCFNTGGKNPGKTTGRLDMKHMIDYEYNNRIFYNNTYKIKESDLAFGIILDVSGSMSGDGIKNGVITMITLHETLKALNINHSIVTHTTYGGMNSCEIKRYQAFREQKAFNVRKNYAIADIRAESGNCDSAALHYMEEAFRLVKNKDKICMMFSDGEPTECTDKQLKDQVYNMERQGIKVIGIGINYESIKEYYPDNANGKNLKEMLDIVSNILKQYVLEKKE